MKWTVELYAEFAPEFHTFDEGVQDQILTLMGLLRQFGPRLARPYVDTLKGSRYANLKELRFSASHGEWRVAFAFDPQRKAVLLVAGDKAGADEKLFYRRLIRQAEERFDAHLVRMRIEGDQT